MRTRKKLGWLGVAVLGTGGCGLAYGVRGPQEPVSAPILDGTKVFQERGCAQCHTIRGAGGQKGPDLSGVGRRLKKEAIEKQIVEGGGAMPAFGEVLPHEEIAALVQYLRAQREKRPRNQDGGLKREP